MDELVNKKCVPCEGGTPPLSETEVSRLIVQIKNWAVSEDSKKISKDFAFHDFKEAIAFVNAVAKLAETEGHHPDILIRYNRVHLELWTHAINGLSENDFILAAKIDQTTGT